MSFVEFFKGPHAAKTLLALAVLAGLWGAARFGTVAWEKFHYPYMVNLGEPSLSQAIQTLHRGEWPYRRLDTPPYVLVPYGPVYLGTVSLSFFVTSAPFVGGRIVAFIFTIAAAVIAGLMLRRMGARPAAAVLTGLIFLAHPYVARWGVQVNVDMAGMALSLAALYVLSRALERSRPAFWIGGGLLTVLAFFTKSSCVAGAGAVFLTLLVRRRFRPAFLFLAATAGAAGLIYAGLNIATDGQYYFHTTYEISRRLYFWQFLPRFWAHTLETAPLWVAGTIAYVVWALWRRKFDPLFWYLTLSLLLTASLGKQGSDTNYMLPWCAASSIVLGRLLDRLLTAPKIFVRLPAAAAAAAFMVFWAAPLQPLNHVREYYAEQKAFYDKVSVLVRQTPGKILSQDMGLLTANGRRIEYEPFPMAQMGYSGVWDQSLIVGELERREYALAILFTYAPRLMADRNFTPEFMRAFKAHYELIGATELPGSEGKNALFFYRPRD